MNATDLPARLSVPFANSATGTYVRTVPIPDQTGTDPGAASFTTGFPQANFANRDNAGGIPPDGRDVNGIFRQITTSVRWTESGGLPKFNSTHASLIGGYPLGCVLQSTTPAIRWRSTANANSTDPDGGSPANWVLDNPVATITGIPVVDSIALLRAVLHATSTRVFVIGYYGSHDGGGGLYAYDAADTTSTDNGGTVIVATDSGRWKLCSQSPIDIRQFGAKCDLTTNDSAAIQATHDWLVSVGGGTMNVHQAKLNSTFSWDSNKVQPQGDGGIWDFSGITAAGYSIRVIQSEADVNSRAQKNMAHPFRSMQFYGQTGTPTIYGVIIEDTVNSTIPGVTFDGCAFSGFMRDISLGAGSFFTGFNCCDFSNDVYGHRSLVNIWNPASANSGERNTWTKCVFGLVTTENINQANVNASSQFIGCSFDYGGRMITTTGGTCSLTNCHIEGNIDTDYWFYLTGSNNPAVFITGGGSIVMGAPKVVTPLAYVDAAVNTTGLVIKDMMLAAVSFTTPWAAGTGRVVVEDILRYTTGATFPSPCASMNALAYPGFETAAWSNEWSVSGGTPPARVTSLFHSGTASLQFTGVNSQTNQANIKPLPCYPGQTLSFAFWVIAPAIVAAGATFQVLLSYLDANNVVIGISSAVLTQSTNLAAWTQVSNTSGAGAAPPGTRSAILSFSIFNTVSGTPLVNIDDVVVAVI